MRSASRLVSGALLTFVACTKSEYSKTTDTSKTPAASTASTAACASDNGGITLPAGFCAVVFADTLGHVRHIAVNSNGDVYVNTWSGPYYQGPTHPGGFLVALRDTNNDGKADVIRRFGPTAQQRNGGGTGISFYKNALYAEEGDTASKRIVIDASGNLFMDVGSASNSCQSQNRTLNSPGRKGCPELQTRAGIWKYDANKTNQRFSPAERYATGIRNAVGIAIDRSGQLHSTQHGRDQLFENWRTLYTSDQGQNLPDEELLPIEQSGDYGWPYCYFDSQQQKLVLAPEYGGDGGKSVGECASKKPPEAFFPAHWAPDGLMFYTGSMFPAHYKDGAFIAFHGSWNRAPGPQGGYNVVFVPFTGGKPANAAKYEIFADGFAGAAKQPDRATHRPTGLAQAPDGALYIADDKGGRIWKVVYRGNTK
jgi:glucose/arabinose dehydrogenase